MAIRMAPMYNLQKLLRQAATSPNYQSVHEYFENNATNRKRVLLETIQYYLEPDYFDRLEKQREIVEAAGGGANGGVGSGAANIKPREQEILDNLSKRFNHLNYVNVINQMGEEAGEIVKSWQELLENADGVDGVDGDGGNNGDGEHDNTALTGDMIFAKLEEAHHVGIVMLYLDPTLRIDYAGVIKYPYNQTLEFVLTACLFRHYQQLKAKGFWISETQQLLLSDGVFEERVFSYLQASQI